MSSNAPTLEPLCAFDIWPNGTSKPATDLTTTPAKGAAYRWLHMDLMDDALHRWSAEHLPALAARTLLASKTRPRADMDLDGLVLTLRGINLNSGAEQADMVSLRLWVTHSLIVTARRQRVFAIEDLRQQVSDDNAPPTTARMVARITEALVDRIETTSLSLEDLTDELEDIVYDNRAPPMRDMPALRRKTIKLRRHVGPMADALKELAQIDTAIIPPDMRLRLRDTANRTRRSYDELSEVRERLTALTDHIDLAQSARLERNGYRLSVAAGIFLPLGFLTGLFGVNVGGMPGLENPSAFWWLAGAMVALAIVVWAVLRLVRWL